MDIPFVHQVEDNWCWAACCEMLVRHFRKPAVTRCQIATAWFGTPCCTNPVSNACDQGAWPENTYAQHGVEVTRRERAFTEAEVRAQLINGRPVEIYLLWQGNRGAHVALITGVYGNGEVQVLDPWYGPGRRAFAHVQAAYGYGGAWTKSYETRAA